MKMNQLKSLAGHADERGTREYNLALGQRRAETVSSYLILNGIDKNRITVKSFGEEGLQFLEMMNRAMLRIGVEIN